MITDKYNIRNHYPIYTIVLQYMANFVFFFSLYIISICDDLWSFQFSYFSSNSKVLEWPETTSTNILGNINNLQDGNRNRLFNRSINQLINQSKHLNCGCWVTNVHTFLKHYPAYIIQILQTDICLIIKQMCSIWNEWYEFNIFITSPIQDFILSCNNQLEKLTSSVL